MTTELSEFVEAVDDWEFTLGAFLNTLLESARKGEGTRFDIRKAILIDYIHRFDDALYNHRVNQKPMITPIQDYSVTPANQFKVKLSGEDLNTHHRRKTDKEKKA